ncbi:MAG: hypothetical protein ACLP00_03870 [Terracidiphilus sp.]
MLSHRKALLTAAILAFAGALLLAASAMPQPGPDHDHRNIPVAATYQIKVGDSVLQVDFAEGPLDLPKETILAHVQAAASAVATYYGRFPVPRARLLLVPVADRHGILQGTTWGGRFGFPGFTRIRIGEHTTAADLADDWMTTHELTHMAFPNQADDQHWIEEGLATYIEPIARVMTGELTAQKIWSDMVRDMPKGEPGANDQGLDHTHTWGRTYWGGALFCLAADVEIRRETNNRKGLQNALRAIVAAGGTIDQDWDLPRALAIGDQATGTHVLTNQYNDWKDRPVSVDLPKLWGELGVVSEPGGIRFADDASLAKVRQVITKPVGKPISAAVVPE